MIRELRSRHRVMWRVLAIVIPVVLALALLSRPGETPSSAPLTEVSP